MSEKTKSQRTGAKSKRKGKAFEQLVVKEMNRLLGRGDMAVRGWWQSDGGELVPDIIMPGLWIQCGHGARNGAGDGYKKYAQAVDEVLRHMDIGGSYKIPISITRVTGERTIYVTVSIMDLLKMRGEEPKDSRLNIQVRLSFEEFCIWFLKPWTEPKLIDYPKRFIGSVEGDSVPTADQIMSMRTTTPSEDPLPDGIVTAIMENESKVDKW